MMKTTQNKSSGVIQKALYAVMGLALMAIVLPGMASANSGAGAVILNIATVNYDDATGTTSYSATSSASVTVNLVAATPTFLAAPADLAVGSGATATYSYTVTSTANGSDTYTVAAGFTATTNLDATETAVPSTASITLGASVITAHPGATQIQIPAGSGANLADTDIVVINGIDYVISGAPTAGTTPSHDNNTVADTDVGNTIAEVPIVITLAAGPISATAPDFVTTPEIGTQVGERVSLTLDVTGTTLAAGDGTGTVDLTVTSDTDGGQVATDTTVSTFLGSFVEILKLVRNVTAGGGFAATTTGDSLDVLEYQITMTNTSAANATAVTLTDPVPAYTTYVLNSTTLNGGAVADDAGPVSPLIAGVLVDDGVSAAGVIGPLPTAPNNDAVVLFQVTID